MGVADPENFRSLKTKISRWTLWWINREQVAIGSITDSAYNSFFITILLLNSFTKVGLHVCLISSKTATQCERIHASNCMPSLLGQLSSYLWSVNLTSTICICPSKRSIYQYLIPTTFSGYMVYNEVSVIPFLFPSASFPQHNYSRVLFIMVII